MVLVGHHAHHADERVEGEGVLERGGGSPRTVGVVGGVEHDGRAAPDHLEPAGRGDLAQRARHEVAVERLLADERLDRGEGDDGVLGLVGAVQREEERRRSGRAAPAARRPGRRPPAPATRRRSRRPRGPGWRRPRQHRRSSTSATSGVCSAITAVAPALMIPAFSRAICSGESPRNWAWSTPTGSTTATWPSATLVASHDAAQADLDDGHLDRGVGERGVRHADDGLEERQRVGLGGVDEVGVRRHVVERADELLVGQRAAVDADPLAHPLDVGAGEAAGAQVQRAQQRVDHARGRRLAVGAGQVDDGVAALRVAEQLGERADPVERRLEPGLGPAGQQGVLDLGKGLGRARGGALSHRRRV